MRGFATMVLKAASRLTTAPGESRTATLKRVNFGYTELELVGAALAGATSITARRADLEGTAKAGSRFQIAGVSGTYTLTADAAAAGEAVTLSFSPALAGAAADGASLTFTQTYGSSQRTKVPQRRTAKDEEQKPEGQDVVLLEWGAPEPAHGDLLDGRPVIQVEAVAGAYHRVTVGGAAS